MGKLIVLGKPATSYEEPRYREDYSKCNYSNLNAVNNLVRYITRSRTNEGRDSDLIGYGACGIGSSLPAEDLIERMLCVQNEYAINVRGGRRMHHEVFSMLDREVTPYGLTPEALLNFAHDCAMNYYNMGFQVVYALHWEPDEHFHVHFAINSISYMDGKKFHTSKEDIAHREFDFNQLLYHYQYPDRHGASPTYFNWTGTHRKNTSKQ